MKQSCMFYFGENIMKKDTDEEHDSYNGNKENVEYNVTEYRFRYECNTKCNEEMPMVIANVNFLFKRNSS
ncbi:unnamed protein product [Brachionus calyciflorus]|uniref:Uncharacterized protein n=1 Tax=Brachionus calyciflorus TaxID=104777 RepID=A0A813ZYZ1_9BILA|nr:unnamed protein product [Brachionus calyciflorus]